MRIFNEDKTQELKQNEIDLTLGFLKADKLFVQHHEAVEAVEEVSHYKTVKEYPNGGRDVEKVIDTPAVEAREAYDEYEDIQVYIPYSEAELEERKIAQLRAQRETECFPYINRGALWYETLTDEQLIEFKDWYNAWLNVTETLAVPVKPEWLV